MRLCSVNRPPEIRNPFENLHSLQLFPPNPASRNGVHIFQRLDDSLDLLKHWLDRCVFQRIYCTCQLTYSFHLHDRLHCLTGALVITYRAGLLTLERSYYSKHHLLQYYHTPLNLHVTTIRNQMQSKLQM
jgi:hypothetical protein